MKKLLTTENSIIHKLFINTLMVQIVTFIVGVAGMVVDGAVISGQLGNAAAAAYSYITPVTTIYAALGGFLSVGVSTLCGKGAGSADINRTNKILSTGLFIAIGVAIVTGVLTFSCAKYIAIALGARDEVLVLATRYLQGFGFTAPALMLTVILMPVLQIDGDRQLVFVAVIAMTVTNIVISILSGQGVFGAEIERKILGVALATTLSYYVSLVILLLHFLRKKRMVKMSIKLFDKTLIKDLLTYGLPYAVQQGGRALLVICMNAIITAIAGSDAVGAYAIINTAGNLCLAIGSGIGQAVAILAGVFIGEEDKKSLKVLLKIGIAYSIVLNAVLCVIIIAAASPLIKLFAGSQSYSEDILKLAVLGLQLYAGSMIFYSINVVFRSYYQAIHHLPMACSFGAVQNFAAITVTAAIFGFMAGTKLVFLCFIVGELLSFLVLIVITQIKNKKLKINLDDMLFLSPKFDESILASYTKSVIKIEDVPALRDESMEFCKKNGLDAKGVFWVGLAIEEAVKNVIVHNSKTNKKGEVIRKTVIDVKVLKKKDGWFIRLRDNGKLFNPVKYSDEKNNKEFAHFGIRLLLSKAKNVEYLSTLRLNNLVLLYI